MSEVNNDLTSIHSNYEDEEDDEDDYSDDEDDYQPPIKLNSNRCIAETLISFNEFLIEDSHCSLFIPERIELFFNLYYIYRGKINDFVQTKEIIKYLILLLDEELTDLNPKYDLLTQIHEITLLIKKDGLENSLLLIDSYAITYP